MTIVSISNKDTGKSQKLLIAPHAVCDSCGKLSGPHFKLDDLRGPSLYHRRNIMPHGAQREATLTDINHASAQISKLDKEIARLQKSLSSLKIRRDGLVKYKKQEMSLFAPIRRFPDEILQHIFLMVRDGCEDEGGFVSVTNSKGCVQVVTQVCAYWRSVAFSFPRLWSRLIMHCCSGMRKPISGNEPYLERFITLSADVPLHLNLNSTPEILGDRIIRTIANSAKRWKDVSIDNYAGLLQAILMRIPPDDIYSRLESLKIMFKAGDIIILRATPLLTHLTVHNSYRQPVSVIALSSAPSLSSFSVTGLRHLQALLMNFPWAQITTFECINCVFAEDELAATLSSMPDLKSLTFHGDTNATRQILLSQLQSLTLDATLELEDAEETRVDIVNLVVAPKLKALHCIDSEFSKQAIQMLLKRSSCYLEELTVYRTKLDDVWQSKWLANLKKLCLKKSNNIDEELRRLTRGRKDSPDVLPRLETLDLQDIPFGAKKAVQNLLPMIKSRLPPVGDNGAMSQGGDNVSYLKSVTLNFERDLKKSEKRRLNEFISSKHVSLSGVKIDVKYGDYPSDGDGESDDEGIDIFEEMRNKIIENMFESYAEQFGFN